MAPGLRLLTFFLLAGALLSFFLRLVSLQIPVLGNQSWSGYDALSRMGNLQRQLASSTASGTRESPDGNRLALPTESNMPFSIQHLALFPLEVGTALACAVLAILLLLGDAAAVKMLAATGASLAVLAIVHLSIANSDLHSWLQASMKSDAASNDSFSAGLDQLSGMIANSVQLKAGWGMFLLAAALALAAVVAVLHPREDVNASFGRNGIITTD